MEDPGCSGTQKLFEGAKRTLDKREDAQENEKTENKEQLLTESDVFKRLAEIDLTTEESTANSPDPSKIQDLSKFTVAVSKRTISEPDASEFYVKTENGDTIGTDRLKTVHEAMQFRVLDVIDMARREQPQSEPPTMPTFHENCKCGHVSESEADSSSGSESEEDDENADLSNVSDANKHSLVAKREIARKQQHPAGLSQEMCFNEPGQMNDGPACRCSWASKQSGIRHSIFVGEERVEPCNPMSSNLRNLHHYFMKVTPNPVEQSRNASLIYHNDKGYVFEGFSVFFHRKLPQFFPQTPVNKLSQEFEVVFIEEKAPEQFTVHDLESFHTYMFDHLLEMYDLNRRAKDVFDGCPVYHCMPRFVFKDYATEAVEVLPMSAVLHHIAGAFQPVFDDRLVQKIRRDENLFHNMSSHMKGQIFVNPSKRPATIRVDLIERQDPYTKSVNKDFHPVLTHIGLRPSVYTFSAKPAYQQAMKKYLRTRHLMSLQGKLSYEDKQKLVEQEANIRKLKAEAQHKRDMVMSVTSRGFYSTTFYPDIVQHAVLLTLACSHVRYHWCLETFEKRIGYSFKNRTLLELALTHPSFRANYGTNSDHTRNALANCGLRIDKARNDNRNSQVDRPSRKRGYENLREVMSMKGTEKAVLSPVHHNERLEFLGDSVIEFITTIHLFYMLTDLDEGALATYRSALVQNKHLAVLAKKIGLDEFMLYSHGPDLCHESDFRHAMANTYEAMMAAVYLDCDLNECDRIFADTLFMDEKEEKSKEKLAWTKLLDHPLKRDNPYGDRHLIPKIDSLQLLTQFEDSIGIKFKHIRVLAKAFTRRCIGYNNLTHGHNQRLEFLGDTVLQLVTTEYLYKHFPNHHEGHLSLLRTCLVCNRTQGVICDDLAMAKYLVIPPNSRKHTHVMSIRWKERADLVESFIGALYVDRGLEYCKTFCKVCFFPRLKYFIESQRWNDPKSQLQQNCIALRDGKNEPEIPEYRVIAIEGPTNTRLYRVGVYFRAVRLADGVGHTVHLAQMNAAENALKQHADMWPSMSTKKTEKKASHNNWERASYRREGNSAKYERSSNRQGGGNDYRNDLSGQDYRKVPDGRESRRNSQNSDAPRSTFNAPYMQQNRRPYDNGQEKPHRSRNGQQYDDRSNQNDLRNGRNHHAPSYQNEPSRFGPTRHRHDHEFRKPYDRPQHDFRHFTNDRRPHNESQNTSYGRDQNKGEAYSGVRSRYYESQSERPPYRPSGSQKDSNPVYQRNAQPYRQQNNEQNSCRQPTWQDSQNKPH